MFLLLHVGGSAKDIAKQFIISFSQLCDHHKYFFCKLIRFRLRVRHNLFNSNSELCKRTPHKRCSQSFNSLYTLHYYVFDCLKK